MKNFTFARKWHEVLKNYPEEIQKEVYRAAVEYAFTGTVIEMQPLARMAFDFIRYEIDEKARRREERLAKKQAKQSLVDESPVVSKKREKKEAPIDDAEKITADFYAQRTPPQPFTVSNGGIRIPMTQERIRSLVKMSAQEMLAKGLTPANKPDFIRSLASLVA
ncbi:MAG: hypothetical protein K2H39_07275, partial [Paramuribaculum sp.]|nr:hypothetical protein [Paramuribaculum sp.]